jgi:hypothetical protein
LAPEVTHVSQRGLCLLLDGREHFLDFVRFPWFREAPVRTLFNISRPAVDHLRGPELDVDIDLDSLAHPERYPLVSRQPTVREHVARRTVATGRPVRRATARTQTPKRGVQKRPKR